YRSRGLELLRWNTRSCSLVPRHLRTSVAVDKNELLLGRTAREFEQPESFRAILTDNALWHRLGRSRLRILPSFCFGTSLRKRTLLASLLVCHVLPPVAQVVHTSGYSTCLGREVKVAA